MSLPEMQPSSEDNHAGDRLDKMEVIFCRLNIERLLEEAKVLGKLVVIDTCESELVANITPEEPYDTEDEAQPLSTHEWLNIRAVKDSELISYTIVHDVFVQLHTDFTQQLRRDFNLKFWADEEGKFGLIPHFSLYDVHLQRVNNPVEGFHALYNDGAPLSEEQDVTLKASEDDAKQIKGFQLGEIRELAVRALDSVRADLTS